jgi:hypothetical protein
MSAAYSYLPSGPMAPPSVAIATQTSGRGMPAPAMPAFVQAAVHAAHYDHAESSLTSVAQSGSVPESLLAAQGGYTAAPEQPASVRLAIESARSARSASKTLPSTGLLTSWEQEAELLRSMQFAANSSGASRERRLRGTIPPTAPPASIPAAIDPHPVRPATLCAGVPVDKVVASPTAAPVISASPSSAFELGCASRASSAAQTHSLSSSPEPRLADVARICNELDGLFAKYSS